jgi:hypothetical protein
VEGTPKFLLVVNVTEREEGDLSVVRGCVEQAGIDVKVAFALSDLDISIRRGDCDIAVVDLSFPGVVERVEQIGALATRPTLFASMQLWRPVETKPPDWSANHIVYQSANALADELASLWETYLAMESRPRCVPR